MEYDSNIKDAIQTELMLDGGVSRQSATVSRMDDSDFNSTVNNMLASGDLKNETKQKIEKLKNAEVFTLVIDENGNLQEATSSKKGDVKAEFNKKVVFNDNKVASRKSNIKLATALVNQGSSSGNNTGAFHRLQTPASSSTIYNGLVADSVTFPSYDITNAYSYGEAAYMYTGVDGVAEVGFEGVYSQTTAAGWYPVFHAKVSHQVTTGDDNNYPQPNGTELTYVYRSKKYNGGDTISGYKVYYYSTDSTLTIREQINFSDIYVVKFPNLGSTGRSVKRVTAIAMNNPTSTTSDFHYSFTTPAVWRNTRFLTNNSAGFLYPAQVPGLANDVWLHGGHIDYTTNNVVTNSLVESYLFTK
ncbi:hypothetical protein [Paenibacillus pedocola]|uniref:hypothetical protein n=1 Tax=Paenibacillus pedocola TaxID=3242193 RepID=UPI002877FC05|nr:hypothetical protein [Paenibacillus typhae]